MKKRKKADQGRSLIEVVSVLALMALLGFGALLVFQYIIDRRTVSILVDEAVMNHTRLALEPDKSEQDWVYLTSKTGYALSFAYDGAGADFLRLENVPEAVCRALLNETSLFSFWNEDKTPFVDCADTNTIVLGFTAEAGKDCTRHDQCGGLGYCSDEGQCVACENGKVFDPKQGKCVKSCTKKSDCGSTNADYCGSDGLCGQCSAGHVYSGGACVCRYENEVEENGACVCPSGYFRNLNNNCTRCDLSGGREATAEECDKCGGTRQMREGICLSLSCPNGFFSKHKYDGFWRSTCLPCEFSYLRDKMDDTTPFTIEECEACGDLREMVAGRCVPVCGPGKVFGSTSGDSGRACRDCSGKENIYDAGQEGCDRCAETDFPRYLQQNGACTRVSCSDGSFQDTSGNCRDCGNTGSYIPKGADATAQQAECAKCSNRQMSNGKCVFECHHNGQSFMTTDKGCKPCNDMGAYAADATECALCNDSGTPREMQTTRDGKQVCALKTCPEGYIRGIAFRSCNIIQQGSFYTADDTLVSCSSPQAFSIPSDYCSLCDDTPYPRHLYEGDCVRDVCDAGYFQDESRGICRACSDTAKYIPLGDDLEAKTAECNRCASTTSPRRMSGVSNNICALSCGTGYFMDSDGNCRACSDINSRTPLGDDATAKATECARCANTATPRRMLESTGNCIRESCDPGYYQRANGGACIPCSDGGAYNPMGDDDTAKAAECARCDDTTTPRDIQMHFDGYPVCAWKTCPPGSMRSYRSRYCVTKACFTTGDRCFMHANGDVARSCSQNAVEWTYGDSAWNAESCALCDTSDYPRYIVNGDCARQFCDAGYFQRDNGSCIACSNTEAYTPLGADAAAKEAECNKCADTGNPRQMVNGKCVSAFGCASGYFQISSGDCRTCADYAALSLMGNDLAAKTAECNKCANTDYPRFLVGELCARQDCESGYYHDMTGQCVSCTASSNSKYLTASECALCADTTTPREAVGPWCVPTGSTCTNASQFFGTNANSANCKSCSDSVGYYATAEQCARCAETSTPRTMMGDLCVRVCSDTQFRNADGSCVDCTAGGAFTPYGADATAQEAECARCTTAGLAREMVDGKCVAQCSGTQFKTSDGSCVNCNNGTGYIPATEAECTKCVTLGYTRYMFNGVCYYHCDENRTYRAANGTCASCGNISISSPINARECLDCEAFLNTSGKCELCGLNGVAEASEENCNMCDEIGKPREMWNGKCAPTCGEDQQTCTNANQTNRWCCPADATCSTTTEGECEGGKGRKCAFTLVGSGNGPYTVQMLVDEENGIPNECRSDEYCFGKWQANGQYITGWTTTLYGICLKMNQAVNDPVTDGQNPWP